MLAYFICQVLLNVLIFLFSILFSLLTVSFILFIRNKVIGY